MASFWSKFGRKYGAQVAPGAISMLLQVVSSLFIGKKKRKKKLKQIGASAVGIIVPVAHSAAEEALDHGIERLNKELNS